MVLQKKEFLMSERIALTVAFEAMRVLGTSAQPEMLLDKLLLVNVERGQRQYHILFSHSEDGRKHPYRAELSIQANKDNRPTEWEGGTVEIFHWLVETPWSTDFTVIWSITGIPRVELGPITC